MTDAEAVVIIPHRNDLDRLMRCLEALMPGLPPGVEVVVVDNGSDTEVALPLARSFPSVRLLHEPQAGAAAARNRGVAETSAPRLIFIDADCVPEPGWVAAVLAAGPKADLVGGAVEVFHESNTRTGAQGFEAVFAFDNQSYVEQGFSVTANLTTTRLVFEATGPFAADVSEDKDWCLRAVRWGHSIAFAPEMVVSHPSRGDWAALSRKWRRLTGESYALHRSEGGTGLSWVLRALAMPASAVVHSGRVLTSDKLSGPVFRLRTLVTLWRLRGQRMVWMLGQVISRVS